MQHRIIKDGNPYLTDEQQKAVDLANKSTVPPKKCPVCGEKLRRMNQYRRIFFECFNMVVSVTGSLSATGYRACGYKWYYPKDRDKIC